MSSKFSFSGNFFVGIDSFYRFINLAKFHSFHLPCHTLIFLYYFSKPVIWLNFLIARLFSLLAGEYRPSNSHNHTIGHLTPLCLYPVVLPLSLIHISEPTRLGMIS